MTPRQAQLLRLLQRHPEGLMLVDIITVTGGTRHSVSYDMRALRGEFLVGPSVCGGAGVLWASVVDLPEIQAKRAATRAALAAQARERAERRELSAQQRAAEKAECDAFAKRPVHRTLAQADWMRQAPTRGVPSVFHMGGKLA